MNVVLIETEFHSDHESSRETFGFVVNQPVMVHFTVEDTLRQFNFSKAEVVSNHS